MVKAPSPTEQYLRFRGKLSPIIRREVLPGEDGHDKNEEPGDVLRIPNGQIRFSGQPLKPDNFCVDEIYAEICLWKNPEIFVPVTSVPWFFRSVGY